MPDRSPQQAILLATAPIRARFAVAGDGLADTLRKRDEWPHARALAVVLPDRYADENEADPDTAAGRLLGLCTMLEAVLVKRHGDRRRITWQVIPIPDPDTISPPWVWSLVEHAGDAVALDHMRRQLDHLRNAGAQRGPVQGGFRP